MGRTVVVRRWTLTAIDCWQRGCVCEGCFYQQFFGEGQPYQKCQMKAAVVELVRVIGIPEGEEEKGVLDD